MGKVGIFGGTFDPIHFGHLITAQTLLEKRRLSKIIFVPTFISPHKLKYEFSSSEHRYNMTELAISSHPNFEISDFELKRDEVSYTINTLLEFSKKYRAIELIIGFDNLVKFDLWHKPDEILDIAKLVVMKRTYDKGIKTANKYFEKALFVDTPTIEISGTNIRRKVKYNKPIDYFLPKSVKDYIAENNLYKPYAR